MELQELQDLLTRLSIQEPALRADLADGLRSSSPTSKVVMNLRSLLNSPDPDRSDAAGHCLRQMGRQGVQALMEAAKQQQQVRGAPKSG